MLLETIDIKKNDVLIFSENRFDFKTNFKVVYKKNPSRKPEPISFEELLAFINSDAPKNLIVYRLLTNQQVFKANEAKYGIFLTVGNNYELVYPDPIFAIKEIENFKKSIDFDTFRFKIQQVGLTSLNRAPSLTDYSEIYFFDLRAEEAKYQNDRVYAEAIFAFDDSFSEMNEPENIVTDSQQTRHVNRTTRMEKIQVPQEVRFSVDKKANNSQLHKIKHDEKTDRKMELVVPNKKEGNTSSNESTKQSSTKSIKADSNKKNYPYVEKKDSVKESSISQFLKKQKDQVPLSQEESISEKKDGFVNLFKSTSNLSELMKKRSKENVILRLDR